MIKKVFTTGYLRLELRTNSPEVAALLGRSMCFGIPPERGALKASFSIKVAPKAAFEDSDYYYHRLKGGGEITTNIHHGYLASASVDEKKMRVTGAVCDLKKEHHPRIAQTLFIDPLIQLLGSQGCQFLHCALLERNGKSLLVSGPSGSGKSTFAVALALQGYRLLADDKCFFKTDKDGNYTFLAVRQSIGVQPHLWKKFPRLRKFPSEIDCDGKRRRIPADSFSKESGDRFQFMPAAILFPHFKKGAKALTEKLPAKEALKRLWTDKSNIYNAGRDKKNLGAALFSLHQLTKRIPSYEVFYDNRCVDKIGDRVQPLLGKAAPPDEAE